MPGFPRSKRPLPSLPMSRNESQGPPEVIAKFQNLSGILNFIIIVLGKKNEA